MSVKAVFVIWLKKMPLGVDKSKITKVCVDDFAFRKRSSYGTVMVDIDTHRIIDIIDSRETIKVTEWLKSYPNLEIVVRDGSQAYASAISGSHPGALQVTDRFHLVKNLSEAVNIHMRSLFPSRIAIPTLIPNEEMKALNNTRNRSERIRFAQKKRFEGYTINDIALLLHAGSTTIQRYLAIPEDEIPETRENSRERQHQQELKHKKAAVDEVRKLYSEGYTISEIVRLTGHVNKTVSKYLKDDCPITNSKYDSKLHGKLFPYEKDVIKMRSKGITYVKIHEYISQNGYSGTVASLRVFMQKERTHQRNISKDETELVEYIPRKFMCQLIYRKLEKIKGITKEQYDAAIKKYPLLGKLYYLLKEFHRIVFSHKSEELETWMNLVNELQLDELDSYVAGIKNDIKAVKNSIDLTFNNGLAEGSVNKIKLTKRIMYGRNSFDLLKAKLLLNENFRQIN